MEVLNELMLSQPVVTRCYIIATTSIMLLCSIGVLSPQSPGLLDPYPLPRYIIAWDQAMNRLDARVTKTAESQPPHPWRPHSLVPCPRAAPVRPRGFFGPFLDFVAQ